MPVKRCALAAWFWLLGKHGPSAEAKTMAAALPRVVEIASGKLENAVRSYHEDRLAVLDLARNVTSLVRRANERLS